MPSFTFSLKRAFTASSSSTSSSKASASSEPAHTAILTATQFMAQHPHKDFPNPISAFFSFMHDDFCVQPEPELTKVSNFPPRPRYSVETLPIECEKSVKIDLSDLVADLPLSRLHRSPFPSPRSSTCSSVSCYSTDSWIDGDHDDESSFSSSSASASPLPTLPTLPSLTSSALSPSSSEESLVTVAVPEPFSPVFEFDSDDVYCHWSESVGEGEERYWPECRVCSSDRAVAREEALGRLNEGGEKRL